MVMVMDERQAARQRELTEWRVTKLLELAEGAAWAPYWDAYAGTAFDARLDEIIDLAAKSGSGTTRALVAGRVHLFKCWQRGEPIVNPAGQVVTVNLARHAERVERAMARNRLSEPPVPPEVLDRGAF